MPNTEVTVYIGRCAPQPSAVYEAVKAVRKIVVSYPTVTPFLNDKARYVVACGDWRNDVYASAVKDAEDIVNRMGHLIEAVYKGQIGGGFIDAMAALVSRQMTLAYQQAWDDEGNGSDGEPMPDYLTQAADQAALDQFDFVDGLYQDIVDAKVDETGTDQFDSRVDLWANQYTSAYNDGVLKIISENGGKMEWQYGDTDHCPECEALNGIVAFASEWEELDVHPQQAPNDLLTCGGWRCGCSLVPTDQRRSPKAFNTIMNIVSK